MVTGPGHSVNKQIFRLRSIVYHIQISEQGTCLHLPVVPPASAAAQCSKLGGLYRTRTLEERQVEALRYCLASPSRALQPKCT